MDMTKSLVNESPRGRFARRVGAAVMALAAVLVLGACRADGGGFIGDPLEGGPVSVYQGDAEFGFTFYCEMTVKKNRPRAVITGEITYHDSPSSIILEGNLEPTLFPEIRLHGTVEPLIVPNVPSCEEAIEGLPGGPLRGHLPASGEGVAVHSRASSSSRCSTRVSRAVRARKITGDSFSIELIGGAYNGYTRGGYIEGGNVQVEHD